eukprot:1562536-Prymnesium_polylepis.1
MGHHRALLCPTRPFGRMRYRSDFQLKPIGRNAERNDVFRRKVPGSRRAPTMAPGHSAYVSTHDTAYYLP